MGPRTCAAPRALPPQQLDAVGGQRACTRRARVGWVDGGGRGRGAGQVGLGKVLVVEGMRFEDLDELIVGYVDPVVANERKSPHTHTHPCPNPSPPPLAAPRMPARSAAFGPSSARLRLARPVVRAEETTQRRGIRLFRACRFWCATEPRPARAPRLGRGAVVCCCALKRYGHDKCRYRPRPAAAPAVPPAPLAREARGTRVSWSRGAEGSASREASQDHEPRLSLGLESRRAGPVPLSLSALRPLLMATPGRE